VDLLLFGELHESRGGMLLGESIEPFKTFADDLLVLGVVNDNVVDVLGHTGCGGAGSVGRRNNQVGQARHGLVLWRREELRMIRTARRVALCRGRVMVFLLAIEGVGCERERAGASDRA